MTGDLNKAQQSGELAAQTYPRHFAPHEQLGEGWNRLGQYDRGVTEFRTAIRLDPTNGLGYSNLIQSYLALNRFKEAEAVVNEASANGLDAQLAGSTLYYLGFLQQIER